MDETKGVLLIDGKALGEILNMEVLIAGKLPALVLPSITGGTFTSEFDVSFNRGAYGRLRAESLRSEHEVWNRQVDERKAQRRAARLARKVGAA